jgi:acyl-coenzyme A thioesterase PaaI-like protein
MSTTATNPALDALDLPQWLGVFVVRSQANEIELLLPYRDEFSTLSYDGATAVIHQGIVAALADIASTYVASRAGGQVLPIQSIRIEYLCAAAIGNQLHASGRVIGTRIYVDIRTSDDRVAIARAIAEVSALAHTESGNSAVVHSPQPIYPA